MTDTLTTPEAAREALGEAAFAEAIEDGTLRRVKYGEDTFVLGADVDRALKDQDPRHLAALVRDGADPDDPESPKNLAADLPRL